MREPFAGPFTDRTHAGRVLSNYVSAYRGHSNLLVLGLTRGGMPVAFEVAAALNAPLDMFLVRKLSTPEKPDKPIGAIASGGVQILNREAMREMGIGLESARAIARQEEEELARREKQYRGERPAQQVAGKVVILVDDGVTTGATMRAAITALRERHPDRLVIAFPVAEKPCCDALREEVDELICAQMPEPFFAVARWYRDFSPVMDRQIHDMLQDAAKEELCSTH